MSQSSERERRREVAARDVVSLAQGVHDEDDLDELARYAADLALDLE